MVVAIASLVGRVSKVDRSLYRPRTCCFTVSSEASKSIAGSDMIVKCRHIVVLVATVIVPPRVTSAGPTYISNPN